MRFLPVDINPFIYYFFGELPQLVKQYDHCSEILIKAGSRLQASKFGN